MKDQSLEGTNVLIVVCRKPFNTHFKKIKNKQTVTISYSFTKRLFLGITKLRFKPAYNPYTEPSMEVFSYHEGTVQLCFYVALLV